MSEVDAAASATVSTLVGIYGIPLEQAVATVAAIDDRSDVEKAVAWVIANADQQQADDEDRGGAVEFIHCTHLDDESRPLISPAALTLTAPCALGCDTRENWVCLQCGATHCSRYVNQHALAHQEAAGHPTGLSLGDLNVWCFACDAYVEHPRIEPLVARAQALKFGGSSTCKPCSAEPACASSAAGAAADGLSAKQLGKRKAKEKSALDELD